MQFLVVLKRKRKAQISHIMMGTNKKIDWVSTEFLISVAYDIEKMKQQIARQRYQYKVTNKHRKKFYMVKTQPDVDRSNMILDIPVDYNPPKDSNSRFGAIAHLLMRFGIYHFS